MITLSRKLFATAAFGFVLLYMILLYSNVVADPFNHFQGRWILLFVITLFVFATKTYIQLTGTWKWYDRLIIISIGLTWMVLAGSVLLMYVFTLGWS